MCAGPASQKIYPVRTVLDFGPESYTLGAWNMTAIVPQKQFKHGVLIHKPCPYATISVLAQVNATVHLVHPKCDMNTARGNTVDVNAYALN